MLHQVGTYLGIKLHKTANSFKKFKRVFNKNDFFGILYFLSGFVLILLSFIRINEGLKNITGTNSSQIAQNLWDSIKTSTDGLSAQQLGILKYTWTMFTG